jgi:hypothetical protein
MFLRVLAQKPSFISQVLPDIAAGFPFVFLISIYDDNCASNKADPRKAGCKTPCDHTISHKLTSFSR